MSLMSGFDYLICISMLLLSIMIGVYYGFVKRQNSPSQYLFGGKEMKMWPISLSISASALTGISIIGLPVETYAYGITSVLCMPGFLLIVIIINYIYLPVFYQLDVKSMFEYVQLRFDRKTRLLTSFLYAMHGTVLVPLSIYIPSLVLSQGTGISTNILSPVLCIICVFYTTAGGMKAVVWTDVLQFFYMVVSIIFIIVLGIADVGGIEKIIQLARDNERMDIKFDFDLTLRDTFWTGSFAFIFTVIYTVGLNQSTIQKCLCVPSLNESKRAVILAMIIYAILTLLLFFIGFIIFAEYIECDPLKSNQISRLDQIFPFYALNVSKKIPGLAGLYITGIVSAGLSTVSASMNCLATTLYEDFLKGSIRKDLPEKTISLILKITVVVIGTVGLILVFAYERFGYLFPLAVSLVSLSAGSTLGIFTVGLMVPMVNAIGAFTGGIISTCFVAWISLGGQFYRRRYPYKSLPTFTNGCANSTFLNENENIHLILEDKDGKDDFVFYKISHYYYIVIGFTIVIFVSVVVSLLTKNKSKPVRRDCITPCMQFLLSKENEYEIVENVQFVDIQL